MVETLPKSFRVPPLLRVLLLVSLLVCMAGTPVPASMAGGEDTRLNLRQADLSAFIELVARITKRNFIVDPRVTGKVTIIAPETVEPDAVYKIFLNVLQLNRYAVIEGEGADRIVPMQLAHQLSPKVVERRGEPARAADFVTRAVRVEHMPLKEAAAVVRPLLPVEAVLTAYPTGRLLILSDREANVSRIEALLARLDRPRAPEIEVLTLRNATASHIVNVLEALKATFPGAKVTADPRLNSLLVGGSTAFREQVRQLVAELDRPRVTSDATVVSLRYANAANIATLVSKLFAAQPGKGSSVGRSSVVADVATNSILILAPPELLSSLVAAVEALDKRPSQVLVEGVIFEMGAEEFAQLGVQFGGVISDVFAGGTQFSVGEVPTLGSLVSAILAGRIPALGAGLSVAGGNVRGNEGVVGLVSALARDATTNILATPSILTLDSVTAEIVVARNVPFVTGRFSTVGNDPNPSRPFQTIQRQDVGLTLRVTPQITADNTVRLRVEQEVSNLTAAAAASGSEITQRRAIDTTILVGDRKLVLLGGLLEDQTSETGEKVPGLGNVPILKYLFGAKSGRKTKRILLVLLRPTIIRNDVESARAMEQSYYLARSRGAALLAKIDGRHPGVQHSGLPAQVPTLGVPFRTGSTTGHRGNHALMPPLPPRLIFDQ